MPWRPALSESAGYVFQDEIAIADIAFRAWGETPEAVFRQAALATVEVMVADPAGLERQASRRCELEDPELEMLLFDFLQEIIFYKDAEQLLLLPQTLRIGKMKAGYRLTAELAGEPIDPQRHEFNADVKAVTLHRFALRETAEGWEAEVVLDI